MPVLTADRSPEQTTEAGDVGKPLESSGSVGRPQRGAPGPDQSWKALYRVGAVSAALYVLLVIVPVVLLNVAEQPPLSGGAKVLQYIAQNKAVYITELVAFVGLSLPAMVVFLALYGALKHQNKSYAALGALVGIASEIIALAYSSSPPSLHVGLLRLSEQYAVATSEAQRAALAGGAEGLVAVSNAANGAGILTALGILIISLTMLPGVFSRSAAYVGILTGALGLVSETFRDVIGLGYYAYGLLLPTWFILVGWKLYVLGWAKGPPINAIR